MKQVQHILIKQEEAIRDHEFVAKMEHVVEWANKMGREGKLVGHFDVKHLDDEMFSPYLMTCVEYVTDDDYILMLKSGKIIENKEKKPEEEPVG